MSPRTTENTKEIIYKLRKDLTSSIYKTYIYYLLFIQIQGISRASILRHIPFFDIIHNCCLDSMHCCWEGIVAQMKSLWFNSKNHSNAWYIGIPSNITRVNKKLQSI